MKFIAFHHLCFSPCKRLHSPGQYNINFLSNEDTQELAPGYLRYYPKFRQNRKLPKA
jgi:hypothetical protein